MKDVFALIGIASVFLVAYALVKEQRGFYEYVDDSPKIKPNAKFVIMEEEPCNCGQIVLQGYDVESFNVKPYFDYPAYPKL